MCIPYDFIRAPFAFEDGFVFFHEDLAGFGVVGAVKAD
jgi:hypothetical protein